MGPAKTREWTEEETKLQIELAKRKERVPAMARKLGRHIASVRRQAREVCFCRKAKVRGSFPAGPDCRKRYSGSEEMADERARPALNLAIATVLATVLGGCSTGSQQAALQEPGVVPETPATIRADQIVGRWGVASYQDPKDRPRVEAAAKAQCKLPYVITAGASGGVVMHIADEAAPQELRLKGSPGGKNYIGPPGPAGGEKDREVVSVDGRLLITRFVDPDAAKRYGYMVYVRCT